MMEQIYQEILDRSLEPSAQSLTVEYLAQNLNSFLKRGERVLICFPEHEEGSLSWLMEKAVLRCGGLGKRLPLEDPAANGLFYQIQRFYRRASDRVGPDEAAEDIFHPALYQKGDHRRVSLSGLDGGWDPAGL